MTDSDIPNAADGPHPDDRAKVRITSFGAAHRDPPGGDALVVDLTGRLSNPQADPAMRERTGLDPKVRDHVLATPGATEVIDSVVGRTLALLDGYADERGEQVLVHVFCRDGRHRSVVVAEQAALRLRERGIGVEVVHRHIDRPLVVGGDGGGVGDTENSEDPSAPGEGAKRWGG